MKSITKEGKKGEMEKRTTKGAFFSHTTVSVMVKGNVVLIIQIDETETLHL